MGKNNFSKNGNISKETWNKFAEEDAEFYILTKKGKENRQWEKEEFFKEGQNQWTKFKEILRRYKIDHVLSGEKIALDLGCGIGRMSFAMSQNFNKVYGIDVSEVMIEKAKELQQDLQIENVEFKSNNGNDLSIIEDNSIDFIFSYISLQHCPSPKQVLSYINEFSRVLKPTGVSLFQTRVAPTIKKQIKVAVAKNIKPIFKKGHHVKRAFWGNWVRYSKIFNTVNKNFSAFYMVQSPIELFSENFWKLNSEDDRWKRSFWICIK